MLRHILVPLDGSPAAEAIIPHVIAFASAFNANVTLVHAMDPTPVTDATAHVAPMSWHVKKSEMRAYLDAIAEQLARHGLHANTVLLEGRVVESIADFVRANAVDLLALTRHGHGECGELPLGSTAQRLLLRCCAHKLVVRISSGAPSLLDAQGYRRLLVPLDGSWRAECVLPLAHMLAERMHAGITYAHAVRRPEMARRVPLSDEEAQLEVLVAQRNRADAEAYFEQLRARVAVETDTAVVDGANAGVALHELAERMHPDLIVLSAHGYSGVTQLPFGSVTGNFVTYSTAPVLIVRDDVPELAATLPSTPIVTRHQETPQHA